MEQIRDYKAKRLYRVYIVLDEDDVMYIGSSQKGVKQLEENHREWRTKGYDPTYFRRELERWGKNWTFHTLFETYCTRAEIEELEGRMIRKYNPKYNLDRDPVASSIKHGRITPSNP